MTLPKPPSWCTEELGFDSRPQDLRTTCVNTELWGTEFQLEGKSLSQGPRAIQRRLAALPLSPFPVQRCWRSCFVLAQFILRAMPVKSHLSGRIKRQALENHLAPDSRRAAFPGTANFSHHHTVFLLSGALGSEG